MKKRFLGILAVLAVFCIALVGCGGPAEDYSPNFAGNWQLVAMESADNEVSEQDLQDMKDLGLTVDLTFADDGTCSLVMFGEDYGTGTWKDESAAECAVTMEDQSIDVALDSATGRLTFAQGDEALIFERV